MRPRRLTTVVAFVVDAFIGELLAIVDQGIYGVVVELDSFFAGIGFAEGVDA